MAKNEEGRIQGPEVRQSSIPNEAGPNKVLDKGGHPPLTTGMASSSKEGDDQSQSQSTASSSDLEAEEEKKGEVEAFCFSVPDTPSPVPMTIDTCEDLWTRLHDIRINGCVLEYVGRGKSIYDNGLAQSNTPLTPMNHYYEVKIIHPGENCYIAVGLARKDYPSHKHPGWNRGSIAYHADDGKIFIGSGIGTPFGPRCQVNDVLGCGIVFPSNAHNVFPHSSKALLQHEADDADRPWSRVNGGAPRSPSRQMDNSLDGSSESEDDIWWNNKNQVYDDKVQVFFMRNGRLLGMKQIRIPKGGFYPTIGMMSRNEKTEAYIVPK